MITKWVGAAFGIAVLLVFLFARFEFVIRRASMTVGKGKRPRDPNQLAKWVVDRSTGEVEGPEAVTAPTTTVPPVNLSAKSI